MISLEILKYLESFSLFCFIHNQNNVNWFIILSLKKQYKEISYIVYISENEFNPRKFSINYFHHFRWHFYVKPKDADFRKINTYTTRQELI
jgi:hypothetical protein